MLFVLTNTQEFAVLLRITGHQLRHQDHHARFGVGVQWIRARRLSCVHHGDKRLNFQVFPCSLSLCAFDHVALSFVFMCSLAAIRSCLLRLWGMRPLRRRKEKRAEEEQTLVMAPFLPMQSLSRGLEWSVPALLLLLLLLFCFVLFLLAAEFECDISYSSATTWTLRLIAATIYAM